MRIARELIEKRNDLFFLITVCDDGAADKRDILFGVAPRETVKQVQTLGVAR